MKSDISIPAMLKQVLAPELRDDIGASDLTTSSLANNQISTGSFIAKKPGVLAGLEAIKVGYCLLDPDIEVNTSFSDGDFVKTGDNIAEVKGKAAALLTGERIILNLLQHLSGIATETRKASESLKGSHTRVCDTRKTLPGLRSLQKYAVRCGGGFNHRFRLDDGVMIKDNHIVIAGGISSAVSAVRKSAGLMVKIEVECETTDEIREAVAAGADVIMLDNKTPEEAKRLRAEIPSHILVELSGGITSETIGRYRDCGADYISLGSLTHSVTALDISFNLSGGKK